MYRRRVGAARFLVKLIRGQVGALMLMKKTSQVDWKTGRVNS